MKRVVVTGASGFIGRHLIESLKQLSDITIVTMGRSSAPVDPSIPHITANLYESRADWFEFLGKPEILIHLAWGHLNNFKSERHLTEELPAHKQFLESMIFGGLKSLTVAGTCFEYGLHEGCLSEESPTDPVTAYGTAKHELHTFLENIRKKSSFNCHWLRYFYMYGSGQSPKSIIPLLDAAIDRGDEQFNMSGGEQVRDYLPVEQVASMTAQMAVQETVSGTFNICSGKPVTVLELVESRLKARNASITLNRGFYPYPDYEPMSFWGDSRKIQQYVLHEKDVNND